MANQTPNYNLDLYETGDAAALTDQYNSAMHKIDTDLKTFNQGITSASQLATTASQLATTANNTANSNKANLSALGVTDTSSATTLKNKIDTTATTANQAKSTADANKANLSALGVTDPSSATTLKNLINDTVSLATDTKNTADTNTAKLNALGANSISAATIVHDKIRDTANTANANTAKLNALGVDTTTHAMELKNKINKNTTDIETINSTLSNYMYNSGYMVTFGDSYADSSTQTYTWPYWLQQYIPTLTLKNYAVSGAGFAVDTRTFINQINTAYNDGTLDKTKVKLAVLAGGRNDILDNGNAKAKMQECVNRIITIFPNARVLIVPMLYDDNYVDAGSRPKLAGLTNGASEITSHTRNAETLKFAYLWIKGMSNAVQSDSIHPNQLGAQIIAKYMYNGAYDNYTARQEMLDIVFGDAQGFVTLQDGIVTYDVQGSVSNIGSGQGRTLPGWASTWHNVWAWGVSAGSTTTPRLYQFLGTGVSMMNYSGQTGNMSCHATWTA